MGIRAEGAWGVRDERIYIFNEPWTGQAGVGEHPHQQAEALQRLANDTQRTLATPVWGQSGDDITTVPEYA